MQIKLTTIFFPKWGQILKCFMRTFILLCCTTVLGFSGDDLFPQEAKVTIDTDRTVTIFEVFQLIGQQTDCTFIYQSDIFRDVPKIHLKSGEIKVMILVAQCLPERHFEIYSNKENLITISRRHTKNVQQDTIQVKGTITDINGLAIAGAAVSVLNTSRGVVSDFDGQYQIMARPTDTLAVSFLGYRSQRLPVQNRSLINVVLVEDAQNLKEVVINAGYYSVKDRERTGSIEKVSEDAIEQQPTPHPLSALQGRVAGVEVTQTTGVPGGGFTVKIRGQNSIRASGNDPLYIIDGVPYASSTLGDVQTSGSILPGSGLNPLNALNGADIQSIEILKDADATAIYGSRGANGVVLITTKKGAYGATKMNIGFSTGLGTVANRLDLLKTEDYLTMRREAFANDGVNPLPFNAYDVNGTWDTDRYTDWQDVFFGKTAYITDVQGSVSGGSEQTQFLIRGAINKQTTVFPGDFDVNKISVLANFSHRSKNDRLSLNFSANFIADDNQLMASSLVRDAFVLAPNAPALYQEDGSLNWEQSTWRNPLSALEGHYNAVGSNLISNLTMRYKIIGALEAVTSVGYTQGSLKEIRTVPSTTLDPAFGLGSQVSSAIHNNGDRKSWIIEPQLHWHKEWLKLKVETLGGLSFQSQSSEKQSQFANGFSSNSLIENLGAASTVRVLEHADNVYRYNAVFGRLNFNYDGMYLINLTGRRDGSSRFGPGKRFSNFGAVGAAYVFTEAHFAENLLPFLSFGKLRGSYGIAGNDQIGDYQYLDTYTFGSTSYDGTVGLNPTRLYNPDYSWEKNKKFELALELGFLKDRIFIGGSYYRNKSSNQLIGIPMPGTTGFNSINANLDATLENRGWEFTLNTSNIRKPNFEWSTSFNISFQRNRLLKFPNLEGSTFANQLAVGEALNILKLYAYTGVNPETGVYEFTDFDGDGIISAPQDRQVIKDLNPDYFGGLNNRIVYKGFTAELLFQFTKQLGLNYNATSGLVGGMANQLEDVMGRWQMPGDQTEIQRFTNGQSPDALNGYRNYIVSDAVITDASFLRLKTLSLSYRLSTLDKKGFGCEIFARGQNLWTLTNYNGLDPETRSSITLPPLRIITMGTTFTF